MSIQDFITTASMQLDANDSQVRIATGGILKMIRSKASPADVRELLREMPGSAQLLASTSADVVQSAGAAEGGIFRKLSGIANSALGGRGAEVIQGLSGSGLEPGKLTRLVPMFFHFARSTAGDELVNRVVSRVPGFQKLVT